MTTLASLQRSFLGVFSTVFGGFVERDTEYDSALSEKQKELKVCPYNEQQGNKTNSNIVIRKKKILLLYCAKYYLLYKVY